MLPVTSIHWHTHKGCCSARRHNWCWVCWGGSNLKHTETPITESAFLIFDFKEVADIMKDIERQAYFRTGRRCPQGPDLALSKPTKEHFTSFVIWEDDRIRSSLKTICSKLHRISTFQVSRHYMWTISLWEWEPQVVRPQTSVITAATDQAVWLNQSEGISLFLSMYAGHQSHYRKGNIKRGSLSGFMIVQSSWKNILGQRIVLGEGWFAWRSKGTSAVC